MSTKKQPTGIPTGSEFAANEHDEAGSTLAPRRGELTMVQNTYKIAFDDGRDAEVLVEHRRGADNTWGSGLLFDATGTIVARAEPMRYLSYDCDTEIVATVIAKRLDESVSPEIWQILEDQMPECRCDLDDEEEKRVA